MGVSELKAERKTREKRVKEIREENKKDASTLKGYAKEGGVQVKILMHNGVIGILYGMAMLVIAYMALQVALVGVAMGTGSMGAYNMETVADMLTMYTVLIMVCGFCLAMSIGIDKALFRAAKRRMWKKDRSGGIDRGAAWRERHEEGGEV